ncbi:MAG: transporter substrate-binding domain-containing protein [Bacteroidales bacterium]|nr:transporter substrate-binding domain-containing protein [Bacteroidales bacterium]
MKPKTRQLTLYCVLLIASVALFIGLRSCGDRQQRFAVTPSGPSAGDTLDVALIYGPASYYMYADTLGGYNYDLLRLISKGEGVPMKFWPVGSLQEGLEKLKSGRYDMLASLPVDADYTKTYLYSDPIYLDRQVLVQRRRSDGTLRAGSALDLARDTVHIEQDSPIAARLANLSREIGDTIYVERHSDLSSELLTLKVNSGEIRYAVVNEQIARPLLAKFPELDISSPISFTQFQGIVLAPGDTTMQRRLNGWLKKYLPTPAVTTLKERYHL